MNQPINEGARCAVIGHGSWATALVKILLENEPLVGWYVGNPAVRERLLDKGNNPKYLRDVHFNTKRLAITDDIDRAVAHADIVVLAVPSAFIKDVLARMKTSLSGKFVISAIKGIIPNDYLTVAEYLNRRYDIPYDDIGIVTGPCHSEEVALERLSYLTLVCKSIENAKVLCEKFSTEYIRTSPSTDIYGTEYAAVLKNIYAICAGICAGLGYGDNFMAVLVSNATMEMERFMRSSYDTPRDVCASAYLGDLLVTSYSQFSRNRTFGAMVGKGYSIEAAQASMNMVAEGYFGAACIMQVNRKFDIDMPIASAVYRILYEGSPASTEIQEMTKQLF